MAALQCASRREGASIHARAAAGDVWIAHKLARAATSSAEAGVCEIVLPGLTTLQLIARRSA